MWTRGVALLCFAGFLAACGDEPAGPAAPTPDAQDVPRTWVVQEAFSAGVKLGACDVGDVRTDLPGREIVAVAADGSVFVIWRTKDGWAHEKALTLPGEMIQVTIGDVDPDHPGEEIVAVGMLEGPEAGGTPGAAHLIRHHREGRWEATKIFEDERLLHAVAIQELDAARSGREIVVAGFSGDVTVLGRDGARYVATASLSIGAGSKNALAWGEGVALACTDGAIRDFQPPNEGQGQSNYWTGKLDEAPAGQARLGGSDGRMIAARDDGVLALISGGGHETIHEEPEVEDRRLRGAVLAELDPSAEGLEAATCGYRGALLVLYPAEHGWDVITLHTDPAPLHHLHGEDFLPEGEGVELVTCGYGGRVLVALRLPR